SCVSKSCYFPGANSETCLARAKDLTEYSQARIPLGHRNPHKEVKIVGPVCEFNAGIYADRDFADYCKYFKGSINPTDSDFNNPVCETKPRPPVTSTEGINAPPITIGEVTALPAQQPAGPDQPNTEKTTKPDGRTSQDLLNQVIGKTPPLP
ncbi:hypothetical protein BGZ95_005069, partial [Linnemannia exigua]